MMMLWRPSGKVGFFVRHEHEVRRKGVNMKRIVMVLAMLAAFGAMAQEPALRFGFLTDTHINADGSNLDRVQKALTLFKTNGVDLVVHGGDLCSAFYPVGYVA